MEGLIWQTSTSALVNGVALWQRQSQTLPQNQPLFLLPGAWGHQAGILVTSKSASADRNSPLSSRPSLLLPLSAPGAPQIRLLPASVSITGPPQPPRARDHYPSQTLRPLPHPHPPQVMTRLFPRAHLQLHFLYYRCNVSPSPPLRGTCLSTYWSGAPIRPPQSCHGRQGRNQSGTRWKFHFRYALLRPEWNWSFQPGAHNLVRGR